MNGTAAGISRTSIHLVVFCSALFFTTANAEDQTAAGAPAGDLLETPAEGSTGAWDKTKEVSGEAWEATKEGSAKAWEKTREVTHDTMEKISPSDPADTQDQEMDGIITPAGPTETR